MTLTVLNVLRYSGKVQWQLACATSCSPFWHLVDASDSQKVQLFPCAPLTSLFVAEARNARFQAFPAKQMRTALFWAITQRVVAIPYRRFGTLDDFTDSLSRNVGKELPLHAA